MESPLGWLESRSAAFVSCCLTSLQRRHFVLETGRVLMCSASSSRKPVQVCLGCMSATVRHVTCHRDGEKSEMQIGAVFRFTPYLAGNCVKYRYSMSKK